MRSPLQDGPMLVLDTVASTQDEAAARLDAPEAPGVVLALHQENGRGRLGRAWISERGVSLTMSLLMRHYAGHPRPWLLGMAVSLAVAKSVQGKVRWPNDVVKDGHKVAGVLTEVRTDARGRRVPIIGVGVNVLEAPFLKSLEQPAAAAAPSGDPQGLAEEVFEQMRSLPEPSSWAAISQVWLSLDDTPGKPYRLPTGELAVALRVGNDGSLLCTVDGQQRTALAADAVMGQ